MTHIPVQQFKINKSKASQFKDLRDFFRRSFFYTIINAVVGRLITPDSCTFFAFFSVHFLCVFYCVIFTV